MSKIICTVICQDLVELLVDSADDGNESDESTRMSTGLFQTRRPLVNRSSDHRRIVVRDRESQFRDVAENLDSDSHYTFWHFFPAAQSPLCENVSGEVVLGQHALGQEALGQQSNLSKVSGRSLEKREPDLPLSLSSQDSYFDCPWNRKDSKLNVKTEDPSSNNPSTSSTIVISHPLINIDVTIEI